MKFELNQQFNTTPETIYNTWLNSDEHTLMTGGVARIKAEIKYKYIAWDGYISGEIIDLIPFGYMKFKWRTTNFKENQEDSILEIFILPHKNGSILNLIHSNLLETDTEYIKGWEDHYFAPMQEYFNSYKKKIIK